MYFLTKKILNLKKKNPILLLSGGIDSYLAWCLLQKPESLFIKLQNRNNDDQIQCLVKLIKDHNINNIKMTNEIFSYIEDHDVFFYIYLIYHALKLFPDRFIIFPKTFSLTFDSKLFLYLLKGIDPKGYILTPFLSNTREELYSLAQKDGITIENIFQGTHSCSLNKKEYCGKCFHCIERYIFFNNNGVVFRYENKKIDLSSWLALIDHNNIKFSIKNISNTIKTYIKSVNTFK